MCGCWSNGFLEITGFLESPSPSAEKQIAHLGLRLLSGKVLVKAGKLSGVLQTGNCCVGLSVLPCPLPLQSDKLFYGKS